LIHFFFIFLLHIYFLSNLFYFSTTAKGKFEKVGEIAYPVTLNAYERMSIHAIADTLGLEHASTGEGKERALVVRRKRKEGKQEEEREVEETQKGKGKTKKQKKVQAPADPYADEVDVDMEKSSKGKKKEEKGMIQSLSSPPHLPLLTLILFFPFLTPSPPSPCPFPSFPLHSNNL
jgi:hypothetical protein